MATKTPQTLTRDDAMAQVQHLITQGEVDEAADLLLQLSEDDKRAGKRKKLAHKTGSKNDTWRTPPSLFELLNDEFHFEWDLAADVNNALCKRFYTAEDNALQQEWTGVCWCNPPYSQAGGGKARWVKKAYDAAANGATVVMLLPATTEQAWFHDLVLGQHEVRFVKGRLTFLQPDGTATAVATFPSMILVFRPGVRHGD